MLFDSWKIRKIEGSEEYEAYLLDEVEGATGFVQDGSDSFAELDTLPVFGCVLHSALEGPEA